MNQTAKTKEQRNRTYQPKGRIYVGLTMPEDLHVRMLGKCQLNNVHVSAYIRDLIARDLNGK